MPVEIRHYSAAAIDSTYPPEGNEDGSMNEPMRPGLMLLRAGEVTAGAAVAGVQLVEGA